MKPHLLVIDDEAPIRELLSEYLRKHGYDVSLAATADEASRLAKDSTLNLVILDLALPDADGLEVLELIKSERPALPVIILTGMGYDDDLLTEALRRKASGYLSKLLPLDQLLLEVRRILNPPPAT